MLLQKKYLHIVFLFIYTLLAAYIIVQFELSFLPTVLLFFGVPSVYLSFRKPEVIQKPLIFSLITSLIFVFMIDYIAHVSNSWYTTSTLGIRVFNTFPLDEFIWGFLFSYFILIFYEYFFNTYQKKFSSRMKYFISILLSLLVLFIIIYLIDKTLLIIPYFYSFFVLIFFIFPLLYIFLQYPHLIKKILPEAVFFTLGGFVYEYVALTTDQWFFNGTEYIGWSHFFDIQFPIEELMWIFFVVPVYLGVYEYFAYEGR